MRRLETFEWWPELVALKDELSLRELSQKFDVTPGAISAALKREGISRKAAPPGPRIHRKRKRAVADDLPPEAGEDLIGEEGDARPGSKDALVLAHRELLGNLPDREVADLAGVSVRTIASFRARHNIPAFTGPKRVTARRRRGSKIEPFEQLLGKSSDAEVAKLAGVTANAVRNHRARLGVSAPSAAKKESVAPTRVRASGAAQHAWRVVIQTDNKEIARVVLADSVVEAAQSASNHAGTHLPGRVVSLSWVGEVL